MFGDILGEDEDVVQVDDHLSFGDKIGEDGVHHCLKGGQAVAQAEQHHQGFEESSVSPEGSLVLISGLDADIVVAPADVEFGEIVCAAEGTCSSLSSHSARGSPVPTGGTHPSF